VLLGVHMRFWMQAHMLACALMVPGAMQIASLLSVCGYNVASVDGGGVSRSGGGGGGGIAKSVQVLVGALVVVLVQVSQAKYVLVYRQMCVLVY
jgi:hypothetical protein